jgi:hypothetical protein
MEFDDPHLPGIKDLRRVFNTPNYDFNGVNVCYVYSVI